MSAKQEKEEIEKIIKVMRELIEKIKNMVDRGEVIKPDSGNLVKDVLEAIEKYVVYYKPSLKARTGVHLRGSSGNYWTPDVVIEDSEIKDEVNRVKAIIECKEIGERTRYQTYRSAHMPRAYTELADLRNFEKSLKFVVFSKRPDKREGSFDFDALFRSIGAKIIDWSDKYEWLLKFILSIHTIEE